MKYDRYQTKETLKGDFWDNNEYIEILAEQIGQDAIKNDAPVNWGGNVNVIDID